MASQASFPFDPKPFSIAISDEAVEDLKARLEKSRIPDQLVEGGGWSTGLADHAPCCVELGIDRKYLFDWRKQEELLNKIPQFTVALPDGNTAPLRPHSIQAFRRPSPHPFPRIWILIKEHQQRIGLKVIAEAFVWLMEGLGYSRFYAQGGDWGSGVTRTLALEYPKNCLAIHLNLAFAPIPLSLFYLPKRILLNIYPYAVVAKDDVDALLKTLAWAKNESGYYKIQGTKPYSLAVGMNDSPAGLLAWIGEKMRVWTTESSLNSLGFTFDEILTNVCIYWFTETIGSSFRLYKEEKNLVDVYKTKVHQPTGVAIFPMEISRPPKEWLSYNHNLIHYNKMARGGHFAALEEPELLMEDVRKFFSSVMELESKGKVAKL
ncbi:Alpha/Beta hydrolase protein [Chytridium lagenaria]|nr:Alpha/Beta hydrolase protein [Chytridium lagenaria]